MRTAAIIAVTALLLLTLAPALEAVNSAQVEPAFVAADPDTVVYVTKTGKKYHRGSCRYLSKSKIKTTLREAKRRGYGACKVCKPPT